MFAAAPGGDAEDDGWVVCIVHDESSGRSKFIVIDAQRFDAPPVATIHLPHRVPYGAHGAWIAQPPPLT